MNRLALAALAATTTLFLGCPSSGGPINPGSAKVDDLLGYWTYWGSTPLDGGNQEQTTVLGFATAADAPAELPLLENEVDAGGLPAGAVYENAPYYDLVIQQLTTFDVQGGAILQTVLADRNADPGKQYSTKILELTPKQSMVIESKRATSGQRRYEWFERCPAVNPAGWSAYLGHSCPTAFSLGTSMVFDRFGDLHSVSGQGATVDPCQVPTLADVTRTCVARLSQAPNFYLSSLAVGPDDVLRMAYNLQQGSSALHLRERPVRGTAWTDTLVDGTPGTIYDLRLFDDVNGRAIAVRTQAGVSVYRPDAGGWSRKDGTLADGGTFNGILTNLERLPSGQLLVGQDRPPHVLKETPAGYVPVDLPELAPPGSSFITQALQDGKGRIQVLTRGRPIAVPGGRVFGDDGMKLAIAEGGAWKFWPLPINGGAWLAPLPDGSPRVVIALEKASKPAFVLLTLQGDVFAQELLDVDESFGVTNSIPTHVRTAVATAADGSIAVTFDGQRIWVRRPQGPIHPRPSVLKLGFNGMTGVARVRSTDGKVDCSAPCSVEYPAGSRVELRIESQPGYAASLSCPEMLSFGAERCMVNVRQPVSEETVGVVRTPVRSYQQPAGLNLMALGDRFGTSGALTAYAVELNPGGVFAVNGVTLPLANPSAAHAVALFDQVKRAGWIAALPVEPDAVMPAADGGAWAVVHVSGPTTFGAMMLGTSGKTSVLRLRFDATGALTGAATVIEAASASLPVMLRWPAAAVGSDGTAAAVLISTTGFPAQSLTEQTVLAQVDAAGTAHVVPLHADGATNAAVVVEQQGTFAGATCGNTLALLSLDGTGKPAGTRALTGLTLRGISKRGARAAVMADTGTAGSTSVDLGGGPRTGVSFIAEYGASLAFAAAFAVPGSGSPAGFALLTEGGAEYFDLQRVWHLGANLSPVGSGDQVFIGQGTQVMQMQQDDNGLGALLMLNQGAQLDGFHTITGVALLHLLPVP
ncbi:MAG: hypothetical protein K1X89_08830 [Myxococcaceae bacterium]|nr:hypothetical protein [Myxococcaceae bacterium]